MSKDIIIESTSKGFGDFAKKLKATEEIENRLKRSENCICGRIILLSIQLKIGNEETIYAWGCPNCDPLIKK